MMAPPGLPEVEATWEPVDTFCDAFPTFQLFVEGGRDVIVGVVYQWLRGSWTWSWSPVCMAERYLDLALVTSMAEEYRISVN